MSGAALQLTIRIVAIGGCALTSFSLYRTGLFRRYHWFFWFFVFRALDNTAAIAFINIWGVNSAPYAWFWLITLPLFWIFSVLVVLELYRLILEKHPGLYTIGRWGLYLGIVLAVGFALITLLPKIPSNLSMRSKSMFQLLAVDRGVNFGFAILLLLMMFLLSLYPVPLSRNVKLHAVLYTVLSLGSSIGSLLHTFFNLQHVQTIDTVALSVSSGCTLMWFFFLRANGEVVRVSHPRVSPEHESRLLQQIESLNSTLLKVSQK